MAGKRWSRPRRVAGSFAGPDIPVRLRSLGGVRHNVLGEVARLARLGKRRDYMVGLSGKVMNSEGVFVRGVLYCFSGFAAIASVALLLASVYTKIIAAHDFRIDLGYTAIYLPYWLVPMVEGALALWLISGFASRSSWKVAIVTYCIFTTYNIVSASRNHTSCDCFGDRHVAPALMACVDVAIVTGLLVGITRLSRRTPSSSSAVVVSLALASVLAVALISADLRETDDPYIGRPGGVAVLTPRDWIGKPFPLLESIWIPPDVDLRAGVWRIALVSAACHECEEKIIHVIDSDSFRDPPLVVVEIHGRQDGALLKRASEAGVRTCRLKQDRQWYAQTPVIFTIRSSIVAEVE